MNPILYTDTINDAQVCRDDLWMIDTAELREFELLQKQLAMTQKDAERFIALAQFACDLGESVGARAFFDALDDIPDDDRTIDRMRVAIDSGINAALSTLLPESKHE